MFKNEKKRKLRSKMPKNGFFSCALISMNPLLKIDNAYPFIFSALNSLSKNKMSKHSTNIAVIQSWDTMTRSFACIKRCITCLDLH